MRITGFKPRKDYTQNLIKSTYSTEKDYLSKNKHVIWLYQNYSLWGKGNMRNHNFMLHSNEISPHTLGKTPTGKYFSIYFDHRQWLFSMIYSNTFLSSGIWHFLLEELKILAQLSSQDKSCCFFSPCFVTQQKFLLATWLSKMDTGDILIILLSNSLTCSQ